ncbi:polysaccharide deacetylase family protein [Marininema mesophilum]|nr:polysaccharide deacetylase family protein [Marininema mesophilum]
MWWYPPGYWLPFPYLPPAPSQYHTYFQQREAQILYNWQRLDLQPVFFNGPRDQKQVALTFDDGPDDRYTPRILDTLARESAQATFFVLGQQVVKYPAELQRINREGHILGVHGYTHKDFRSMSATTIQKELNQTTVKIMQLTGVTPRYVRTPYGGINQTILRLLTSTHRLLVLWDVDSRDWAGISKQQILSNIFKKVQSGSIILMHSLAGRGGLNNTVAVLPTVIKELRVRGYSIVPLSELLHQAAYIQ